LGMDTEILLIGIGIIGGAGLYLYSQYKKIKPQLDEALADGELSIDEMVDIGQQIVAVAEEVKEQLSPLHDYTLAEIKKMKKAELVALAETLGVDSDGVKAEILERVLANQA
jgi:hypothetical protein